MRARSRARVQAIVCLRGCGCVRASHSRRAQIRACVRAQRLRASCRVSAIDRGAADRRAPAQLPGARELGARTGPFRTQVGLYCCTRAGRRPAHPSSLRRALRRGRVVGHAASALASPRPRSAGGLCRRAGPQGPADSRISLRPLPATRTGPDGPVDRQALVPADGPLAIAVPIPLVRRCDARDSGAGGERLHAHTQTQVHGTRAPDWDLPLG